MPRRKVAKETKDNVVPIKPMSEIEYALGVCYRLLREEGHQAMVVAAMLNCLSAGFELYDIEAAARKYGDV